MSEKPERRRQCLKCQRKLPVVEFTSPVNRHLCTDCTERMFDEVTKEFGEQAMTGVPQQWHGSQGN